MLRKKKNTNKKLDEVTQKLKEFERLSSFFDKYISNEQLIVKYATLFDLQRITYVKGKDFKQFFDDNFADIQKEILEITKKNIGKEANKDSLQKFYSIIQEYNIMHYLKRLPGDKAKYPKKLVPLKKDEDKNLDLIFNESGFYIFQIKVEKSNKALIYLILLIILILFVILFPVWPLSVKMGVLYLLMGAMIFLVALLVLSIVIAIIGFFFGYDIFLLPNLDESKLSWKDRLFKPFVYVEHREDPTWFIAIRIVFIISTIGLCVLGYFFPSIPKECFNTAKNLATTVFNYGKKKVEDIHYGRSDLKVKERAKYLDDLENL